MRKLLKLLVLLALVGILLYLGHSYILDKAGRFLYYKDELKPADVIVVLAGEQTERVEYGVQLFKEGWARKDRIIFSGGPAVWKYTYVWMMQEHAMELGVPQKAILLEEKSRSTEQNAFFTKEILKKHGYKSCILVTSPYHSRRASEIFKKVMGNEIRVISAPSEKSWFKFEQWWERKRDRAVVFSEFSKFIWFWIYGGKE